MVEAGGIFDNIRKTLVYLLSGNAAQLAVMLVAALGGLPLPPLPSTCCALPLPQSHLIEMSKLARRWTTALPGEVIRQCNRHA